MKLRVPAHYDVIAIGKSKRKPEAVVAHEWITVDIREVPEEDAPMATSFKEGFLTDYDRRQQQTRWHHGHHWKLEYDMRGRSFAPLTQDLLQTHVIEANMSVIATGLKPETRRLVMGEVQEFNPADFRTILNSTRDEVVTLLQEQAANVILVAGKVWKRVGEPYYTLERDRCVDDDGTVMLVPHIHYWNPNGTMTSVPVMSYRLDEFERMKEDAKHFYGEQLSVLEDARADVYVPQSLQIDIDWSVLCRAARQATRDFEDHLYGNAPMKDSWAAFEKLVDTSQDMKHPHEREQFCHAAKQWLASVENGAGYYNRDLTFAVKRWEERPLEVDIGHQFRP